MKNPFLIGDQILELKHPSETKPRGWFPFPPRKFLVVGLDKSTETWQYELMNFNGRLSYAPFHYVNDRYILDVIS